MNRRTLSGNKIAILLGATGLLFLTSCAIGPDARRAKFKDEQWANLVIRYSSENAVFRLKPDGHEGPFLRIYNQKLLCAEAAQSGGRRDLAVVLMGYVRSPVIEQQIIQSWTASLGEINYHRVVFLRDRNSDAINGLRIVDDVQIPRTAYVPLKLPTEVASTTDLGAH